jgi:hypothetical protein
MRPRRTFRRELLGFIYRASFCEAAFLRDGPGTLYADYSFRKGTAPSRALSRILRVRS